MKVFSIIVTYNGMQWIEKCLQSLVGQSEVIVVDNYSTDETVSWIQANFADVVLLPQSQNLGFGKANNIGISYALNNGAEAVFLLNQDAYVEKECIDKLVKAHKENPEFGIISPIHFNEDGSEVDYSFLKFTAPFKSSGLISDLITKNISKEIYDINFIHAAAWFIPVKTLKMVGGFDPIFFMYGEDDNYCQRVLYHGLKIGIIPNAKIFHDSSNNSYKSYKVGTLDYYNKFNAELLAKYANINNFDKIKLYRLKFYLLKKVTFNLIILNFEKAKVNYNKFKLINVRLILKSVLLNKIKTSNYLDEQKNDNDNHTYI